MGTKNSSTRYASFRLLAVLCLCLFVAACSMARFAYRNVETISWWWLDGYADFERDQRPLVKDKLDKIFDWHRKTQLRDYAAALAEAQQYVQEPPSAEVVLAYAQSWRKRLALAAEQAAPDAADVALALRPAQLQAIARKFADGNREYSKDYLRGEPAERHRKRYRKLLEQAEYWFGDFSREQEAQIRKLEEAIPMDNELYLQVRISRQQALLAILGRIQTEKPPREQAARWLRDWAVLHIMYTGGSDYGAFVDAYNAGMAQAVAGVLQILTPAQRAYANARLQGFIDDCRELASPQ